MELIFIYNQGNLDYKAKNKIKPKYWMEKSSRVQRVTETEGVRTVCLSLVLGLEKIKASARVSEGRLGEFQG